MNHQHANKCASESNQINRYPIDFSHPALGNAFKAFGMEALLDTAQSLLEAAALAKQVSVQKDNFMRFSALLEKASIFLQQLSIFRVKNLESVSWALDNLKSEVEAAKKLASECSRGNKIYLLLSCKRFVDKLESTSKSLSQAMAMLPLESLDVSLETNEWLLKLCKNMEEAHYQISAVEDEILHKIESGLGDRTSDRSFASDLLLGIAESVGISCEESALKMEFEDFKKEIVHIESRNEELRMEQIVLLLENADVVTTPKDKEMKYFTKRNSLGRQLLEPLPSFYCPITHDIMRDPVETSSGNTFEREAIEEWLAVGNGLCPLTKTPLRKLSLRPNRTLRQSIQEWKDRNVMITIASMKPEIQSNDEEEVLHALHRLDELCEKSELHREWVVMEDYIPIITGLLRVKNSGIRLHALAILCHLAKDSDGNKEGIANSNDSIKYVVCSLARKVEERMLALRLLLELSRIINVRNLIGCAQGGILLLVTLANSDDAQASKYAQELLSSLAFEDENVVQMARAKFFRPLLQRLFEGAVEVQVMMAGTLADLELTDHDKQCLSRDGGALKPLLEMLQLNDTEVKTVAVRALENLSGVASNGLQLIKEGAKEPLFELLFCHALSKLRLHVAKTIMHLAMSTASPEASEEPTRLLETEEDVFRLFSLISYTSPDTQEALLFTFHTLCKSPSGSDIRRDLRQISAVKILVQLCELDDLNVRANAVKLLYYLTQDGDHPTFEEHVNKKCITTLLKIIKSCDNEDEKDAAMGIISNLPRTSQMSEDLLECGALEVIFNCLKNVHASHEKEVVANAAEALCRFTVPSNLEWQKKVVEAGILPVLVKLLGSGTAHTKINAAMSLMQLSESSRNLAIPVKTNRFIGCCFAPSEGICTVHLGICSMETSFCLLEAGAVRPLVVLLGQQDPRVCEASLDAILTLIEGVQLQNGCKVLEEAGAIAPIIKLLNSSSSSLQEKTLGALQRVFRLVDLKTKYGKSAQMSLVDITQRGSSNTKSLAAKILAQLNVLNEQSSFFDGNV